MGKGPLESVAIGRALPPLRVGVIPRMRLKNSPAASELGAGDGEDSKLG